MARLKFDYKRGLTKPELCNIYGICRGTVDTYLADFEKVIAKSSRAEFRDRALINDFKDGLVSLGLLSQKYNLREPTVKRILIGNSIIDRQTRGYGVEMKQKIIALREQKVKVKDIAEQLGVSFDYTRKVITAYRKKIGVYTGKAGRPSDKPEPRNIRKGRAYGELRKAVAEEMANTQQGQTINRAELARKLNTTRQRISQLIKALNNN